MENAVAVTVQGTSTPQYIPVGGAYTIMTNLGSILDTNNGWNAISKKYVVQVAGKYFITGSVQYMDGPAGYQGRAAVSKNGSVAIGSQCNLGYGTTIPICTGVLSLNVGDYLQLLGYTDAPIPVITQWFGTQLVAFCVGV